MGMCTCPCHPVKNLVRRRTFFLKINSVSVTLRGKGRLIEDSHVHQNGFLALGEQFLQIGLGLG